MATRLEDKKTELLERLADRLHERLEGHDAALADAFVRHYYRGVAPQDLVERDPLDLYGAALAHLRFGERRRPGEAKVRVYNPQIEQHGWQSTHTIAEIVNDDMPFLVDSVGMALNRHGLMVHLIIHPVMAVRRDAEGRLEDILLDNYAGGDGAGRALESFMHVEVDRHSDPEILAAIQADLQEVLAEVRAAVEDWRPMLAKVEEALSDVEPGAPVLDPEELAEAKALLRWIADNHFTFLGYAAYDLVEEDGLDQLRRHEGSGLGVLRKPPQNPLSQNFASLPPEVRRRAREPQPLIITKANTRSVVHRPTHLDYIGVQRFDAGGRVIGEHRFLGLFTSAAYNRSAREIPVLRRKATRIMAKAGLPPASHDGKALLNILEGYPRDELFQTPDDELFRIAQGILHLQDRQQIRLFMRRDAYGRFVVCQVFVPRERYNTVIRRRMQAILQEALGGTEVEFQALVSESVLARIVFTVRTPDGTFAEVDEAELEARLVEATRSWGDILREELIDAEGEEEGVRLYRAYGESFPIAYQERFPAPAAVPDVLRIDRLAQGQDDLAMSLYRPLEADPSVLRFKLGRAGRAIPLSDVLPVLEDMGLRVIDEQPYEIKAADGRTFWLHDFGMVPTDGPSLDLDRVRGDFQKLFARVWRGDAENDGFNRLVLVAGLDWRRVTVLRAYCKYMLQIGTPFSQAYIEQTLASNPELASRFAALFDARFDPDLGDAGRRERCAALEAEIRECLEAVINLDEDRILRRYLHLLLATLRTNAFQRTDDGGRDAAPYLSLKFDPAAIRDMPLPRPAFEIFVYSPRTEAVHLRGGKVARGGIRWSDRREDFRTEVLGLMKAQMVKNVVIVPVGAKGGFILKRPPKGADRAALREEAVACYRTLMSGMLDITDNRVGGDVAYPERVVRYDGDDPYLVVAADKGTADFSDIANAISESYGFWLGDAYASGGSQGYDHKAMGITARGAWESVKRMFYELGMDIQHEPFTVVGIGDMSGDVFGNGMLLSEQIKLIAAFDHRHIFIDPNPDPAVSYAERRRLFELPRSTWGDYDRDRLSPGGGIHPRTVKSIKLSPEAREALGTEAEELSPPELIRAVLKAPVDLLWNGGIGTYVKAAEERHADAADRANDPVRVNAEELRCRVVGEGGNLGFTQRARNAFARGGGKINTDFIDNSAGVDTSDHEVNIKILLNAVEQAGDMTRKQRNDLLAGMTDEVAELVLRDNILQVLAVSMAEAEAPQLLDAQTAQMRRLEAIGRLNRELELLPNDEALAERRQEGHGLTRPEIAILIAYAKMDLYDELLASDLPDDPYLARDLVRYFPRPLRKRFRREILEHRLRREIVATQLVNGIVNRTLGAFVDELREETVCGAAEVARAYIVARDAFDLVPLWGQIERLAACTPADLQVDLFNEARHVLERGVRWFMRQLPQPIDIGATVARFGPGIAAVIGALEEVLAPRGQEAFRERLAARVQDGADEALARRLAGLPYLVPACEIVAVAGETGVEVIEAAKVYFALETGLHLDRLRALLGRAELRSRWDRLALAALQDDVFRAERRLAVQALENGAVAAVEHGEMEAWLAQHGRGVERSRRLLAELEAAPAPDVAMMSVAVRALDSLSAVDRTAA